MGYREKWILRWLHRIDNFDSQTCAHQKQLFFFIFSGVRIAPNRMTPGKARKEAGKVRCARKYDTG
jgi:hypothetical protein